MSTHVGDEEEPVGTDVWIGFLEVAPKPGSEILGDAKGAFVNGLALASDKHDYLDQVKRALEDLGMALIAWQDIGRLAQDFDAARVERPLLEKLAREVRQSASVRFTDFHAHP